MMRNLLNCRIPKLATCIHYSPIKAKTLLCLAPQNLKLKFSTMPNITKHNRRHDYNFNFFHQNPTYALSCLQIDDTKQFQKTPALIQNAKSKIGGLSSMHFVNNLSHDQVIETMECMVKLKSVNITNFNLKFIDNKCCSMLRDWSLDTALYVFDAWFLSIQQKAFQTRYFSILSDFWFTNYGTLTKNSIIQIVYYFGLYKKTPKAKIKKLLEAVEMKQKEMNDVEIAIVCLSFFKLRVKSVSPQFVSRTIEVAKNLMIQNERFHLIGILKFLRQLQVYDDTLGNLLQQYILKEASSFNFVEGTNFLATFSTEFIYEKKVFEVLEKQGIIMLGTEEKHHENNRINTHPSLKSRAKDLSKFLWAMVNVGHQLNQATVETVLDLVRMKHSAKEYGNQLHCLVDCLQSFAIINVYPEDLLKIVFTKKSLSLLKAQTRVKPLYQMYFIYKSMEIEHPELLESVVEDGMLPHLKPLPKDLVKQIKERKDLAYILSIVKQLNIPETQFEVCTVLPHIVILGILVKKNGGKSDFANEKKNIYIEVLDSPVCCRNSAYPLGLMLAKLRQMKKLNYNVITVTQDDISLINRTSHQNTKLQELFL